MNTRLSCVSLMLLLGVAMLGSAEAKLTSTSISVCPSLVVGHPGDSFVVSIDISKVEDLYAFEFHLQFAPYASVLAVSDVVKGNFFPPDAYIIWDVRLLDGIVLVGGTLIGNQPGVSGDGTLVSIEFVVVEAGESELTLYNTELLKRQGSTFIGIPHKTFSGYYKGPTANLVRTEILPGRELHICQMVSFLSSVKNNGDVPLYVLVWFEMVHESGMPFVFWAGQTASKCYPGTKTVYLYVDEFSWSWQDWQEVGNEPYLNASDDDSFILGDDYCQFEGNFGFEDLTLATGESIQDVVLEAYTDGPYDDGCDLDVYTWPGFDWLGSLYCAGEPRWLPQEGLTKPWVKYFQEFLVTIQPNSTTSKS